MTFDQDYQIKKIDKSSADVFVRKWHYMGRTIGEKVSFGLFNKQGELVGVTNYRLPQTDRIAPAISPLLKREDILEIGRLVCKPEEPHNIESYFLGATIKQIHKDFPDVKVLLTYAHYQKGFTGIVYQACNFLYIGYTMMNVHDLILNGIRYDKRTIVNKYGSAAKDVLEKIDPHFKKVKKDPAHRYIYIFPEYKDQILPTIAYPILSYPKKREEIKFGGITGTEKETLINDEDTNIIRKGEIEKCQIK